MLGKFSCGINIVFIIYIFGIFFRIGKFGWEKCWGSLENNILLLYREESDVNFIDTFDLNFVEIDVIVYSVISSVEFFNIVSIDFFYVMKLEYEFFIICWFRRCVLRMF